MRHQHRSLLYYNACIRVHTASQRQVNVPNDNDRVGAERSHVHTASVRLGPQAKSARMHRQRRSQISDIRHVAGVLFAVSAHDHRLHQHI